MGGIAAHELGHAIGMLHEQSRTDADQYVQILWDNIQPAYKDQYDTSSAGDVTVPYDIGSLMHYGDDTFAIGDSKTMTSLVPGKVMGNRMGLSGADAKQVAKMYGCEDDVNFVTCTTNVDGCTAEDCICHSGSGDDIFIKAVVSETCKRCGQQCPDYPEGTTGGTFYIGCEATPSAAEEQTPGANDLGYGNIGCDDLTDDCQVYADQYCEWVEQVTMTLMYSDGTSEALDFATEACALTCGWCEPEPSASENASVGHRGQRAHRRKSRKSRKRR